MELTNKNKLAMCIALFALSSKVNLTRYKILKANNTSVYNIKSDGVELDIDPSCSADCDEAFRRLLRNVYRERVVAISPTLEELQDDDVACEKFVEILNTFKLDANRDTLKYEKQSQAVNQLTERMNFLVDFIEESNVLNGELSLLADAIFMLDRVMVKKIGKKDLSTIEEVARVFEANGIEYKEIYKGYQDEYPWIDSPKEESHNTDIDRDLATMLTMGALYNRSLSILGTNPQLDNSLHFSSQFENAQEMRLAIHGRESFEEEFRKFRSEFYSEIMSRHGFSSPEEFSDEEKEAFVWAIVKDNIGETKMKAFVGQYKTIVEDDVLNFGRDSNVINAVALNILSILGGGDVIANLSDWRKMSQSDIRKAFDQNFDLAKSHPALAYQVAQKIKRDHQTSKRMTIQEIFEQGSITVNKDNVGMMPEFIQRLFERVVGDSDRELSFTPDSDPAFLDLFNKIMEQASMMSDEEIDEYAGDDYDENEETDDFEQ